MQSDNARKLKVFLCHAVEDKPAVRSLYNNLIKDGFDAWLDEEKLLPGHDWDLEIHKAERNADAIIICLSKKSAQKEGYVQKEIKFALDIAGEKPEGVIYLIPVRIESCEVPSKLSDKQWVDLFNDDGYQKLLKALEERCDVLGLKANQLYDRRGGKDNSNNLRLVQRLTYGFWYDFSRTTGIRETESLSINDIHQLHKVKDILQHEIENYRFYDENNIECDPEIALEKSLNKVKDRLREGKVTEQAKYIIEDIANVLFRFYRIESNDRRSKGN